MSGMRALQLCPNDHPPFLELCRNHAEALAGAGLAVETVFFASPTAERWDEATYLGISSGTRHMIDALRVYCGAGGYRIVVAHRYRALQVATRAGCFGDAATLDAVKPGAVTLDAVTRDAPTLLAVAHEFGMFARMRRRLRARSYARDVAFAGVSQAVADDLRRDLPPYARTLVLANPVDVERLDRARLTRDAARKRLRIRDAPFTVGVVGRLHPKKRPELAVEAFAAADSLPGDARLVFVGDGESRDVVQSLAIRLGIESRVDFVGQLLDAAQYLRAFDALLFCSSPAEAFGLVLVEAMLAGVPIVCADVPGPRGVLGPDGLYFDGSVGGGADALGRCASLTTRSRAQLCEAQRARAQREFSVEAIAAVYRGLLNTDALHPADAS